MKGLPAWLLVLAVAAVAAIGISVGVAASDPGANPGMGRGMMVSMTGRGIAAPGSEADYLAEMVAHHEEAVAAAQQLLRSDRPEMRAFGESIVATQSAQIVQMNRWLADWYPDHSVSTPYQPMMRDLTGLSGDDLDRAFLQDMIGHHMLAVMMSQHLLWQGTDHEEVATLATSIRDGQHTEIVQMQRWLGQWFGSDWNGIGWEMAHGMR